MVALINIVHKKEERSLLNQCVYLH